MNSRTRENQALSISAATAGAFALAGITWGLWVDSLMILFDGAYSLVSLGLSALSIYAARQSRKPADEQFPYGRDAFEPLVIFIKGLAIMGICLISLISALQALFSGGREVATGMALAFAAVSSIGCLLVWLYLHRARIPSGLVQAERNQWLMDTILSLAVMAGFSVAAWLETTAIANWAVYADPVMVVIVSVWFFVVPARMVLGALRELLWMVPEPATQERVLYQLRQFDLEGVVVKTTKIGPTLYVDLYVPRKTYLKLGNQAGAIRESLRLPDAEPVVELHASNEGTTS